MGTGPELPRVDRLLQAARSQIERLAPEQAREEIERGAVLVDIRSESQRARDGEIPLAIPIARNVLEWRCDPTSPSRDDRISDPARRVIVLCHEGFQSSLAAATLRELGHERAADVTGGFLAWRAAGLPMQMPSTQQPSFSPEPQG